MAVRFKFIGKLVASAMCLAIAVASFAGCTKKDESQEPCPIKSVTALGFVDLDGAKVKAVALEYEQDMTGSDVSASTYTVKVNSGYDIVNLGTGTLNQITGVYVNDKPEVDENGGSGSGNYVIVEVYTDYLSLAESTFTSCMQTTVTQVQDIRLQDDTIIPASTVSKKNMTESTVVNKITGKEQTVYSFDYNQVVIPEIEGFKFYTDTDTKGYGRDGDAFKWEHCFNQQDGKYYDVSLSYALYVPEDWHADGTYAMVTLENPAAEKGTHPLEAVLTTRSPSVYASAEMQEYVKDLHGVDGMIVVVPVVTERVNDNGGTPAEYEALVHLWDTLIEEYNVDENYIYGSGQSVGGMVLIETQRNRDNFFAGLLLYEDQWTQNYYIDTLYSRGMLGSDTIGSAAGMHYPRVDSYITYDYHYDTEGNKIYADDAVDAHDPYNLYYLISDDNMLVLRNNSNTLCIDTWNEMDFLYKDLTGDANNGINQTEIDYTSKMTKSSLESEREQLVAFLNGTKTSRNINTVTFNGGINGYTCRLYDETYKWLLSQTRQSEMEREKLDINKPFELADEQDTSDARKMDFTIGGEQAYYVVGKLGAGTQGYNGGWYNTVPTGDAMPGRMPDGMNLQDFAGIAKIENVIQISDTAVAIKYDKDMSNLTVHLKDGAILALDGTTRSDITYTLDPFEFFDAQQAQIDCTVKNVYVNDSAAVVSGRSLGEGEGMYVIVEFASALPQAPAYMLQRMTLHTDIYFANAYPWTYAVTNNAD